MAIIFMITMQPNAFFWSELLPGKDGAAAFYEPVERGFEREIKKRLEYWASLRRGP